MTKLIALVIASMFATGAVFAGEHEGCVKKAGHQTKAACQASFAKLDLNADQKAKMDAALEEHHKAGCTETSEAQFMKQAESIMTAEQFAKFRAECEAHHKGKEKTQT